MPRAAPRQKAAQGSRPTTGPTHRQRSSASSALERVARARDHDEPDHPLRPPGQRHVRRLGRRGAARRAGAAPRHGGPGARERAGVGRPRADHSCRRRFGARGAAWHHRAARAAAELAAAHAAAPALRCAVPRAPCDARWGAARVAVRRARGEHRPGRALRIPAHAGPRLVPQHPRRDRARRARRRADAAVAAAGRAAGRRAAGDLVQREPAARRRALCARPRRACRLRAHRRRGGRRAAMDAVPRPARPAMPRDARGDGGREPRVLRQRRRSTAMATATATATAPSRRVASARGASSRSTR